MRIPRSAMLLYAITGGTHPGEGTLAGEVRRALEGGVTLLQYREKGLEGAAKVREAKEVLKVCREFGVPLIINDDPELAVAIGADGVHVGQKDMDAEEARRIIGPDRILGVSARTVEQAKEAERAGADYLGSGAVFHTGTKGDAKSLDHAVLREICETVSIPVVAIGGISAENAAELAGTGIAGIAVVSGIFAADDVKAAAQKLRRISEEITQ